MVGRYVGALALLLAPFQALWAQGAHSGLFVGVQGGFARAHIEGDAADGAESVQATTQPRGPSLGLYGGYNHLWPSGLLLGADVSYDLISRTASASATSQGRTISGGQARAELSDALALRGRLGQLLPDKKTLGYVSLGYTNASLTWSANVPVPGGSVELLKTRLGGWTTGIGLERQFTDRLGLRVEWMYSQYPQITEIKTLEGISGKLRTQLTDQALRLGLGYRF